MRLGPARQSITVRHNMEVAHRLFESPGKCENIHGHSMWVELSIAGEVDSHGLLCGLDFGYVKKLFRGHIDEVYDHRVLLNENDPWAQSLTRSSSTRTTSMVERDHLPGLQKLPADPTTENLARLIGHWALGTFDAEGYADIIGFEVNVQETAVNGASWSWGQ
jgi:6-pyruvoyltetrahydropterin/6-carboxytetrahydropterin synthase